MAALDFMSVRGREYPRRPELHEGFGRILRSELVLQCPGPGTACKSQNDRIDWTRQKLPCCQVSNPPYLPNSRLKENVLAGGFGFRPPPHQPRTKLVFLPISRKRVSCRLPSCPGGSCRSQPNSDVSFAFPWVCPAPHRAA